LCETASANLATTLLSKIGWRFKHAVTKGIVLSYRDVKAVFHLLVGVIVR